MRLSFSDPTPKPAPAPAPAVAEDRSFQPAPPTPAAALAAEEDDAYLQLKTDLHRRLIEAMNLASLERRQPEEIRAEVAERVAAMLKEDARPLNEPEMRRLNEACA